MLSGRPKSLNDEYADVDKTAYEFGQSWCGLFFGLLVLFAVWIFWYLDGISDNLFYVLICGILWLAYPGCAFVSAAMSACLPANAVVEQGTRPAPQAARAMFYKYASPLFITGFAFSIGMLLQGGYHILLLAWHDLEAGRAWFRLLCAPVAFLVDTIVGVLLLKAGCQAGALWGESAGRERFSRPGRFLNYCWSLCERFG